MKVQSISDILLTPTKYTGSEVTKNLIAKQVEEKYGASEIKNMDCYTNVRSLKSWMALGYRVRKGEKALKSMIITETKDSDGNILKKHHKPIFLFYYRQVSLINNTNQE